MPAMPSPKRLVRRSIRLIERFGYDRYHAAIMVATIASEVRAGLAGDATADPEWIAHVAAMAWYEVARSRPPQVTQEVDNHGAIDTEA